MGERGGGIEFLIDGEIIVSQKNGIGIVCMQIFRSLVQYCL